MNPKLTAYMFVGIFGLMVGGCSISPPTADEIASADYGRFVDGTTCISIAKSITAHQLKDPGSAQFSDVQCWEGYVRYLLGPTYYGYRFSGYVNGKNSLGGYVGYRYFTGLIRDSGNGPQVTRYCSSKSSTYGCMPDVKPWRNKHEGYYDEGQFSPWREGL